jgi:DNA polymerase V
MVNSVKNQPVYALIDCNNFFVSCERVFRPDLWDKPVAVLSNNDGCIVARSNEVKQLGIPMGVPLFKVRDIVAKHNVTLFSGNFELYGDFSQRVVHTLKQACPVVEVYSVDESFLELSTLAVKSYSDWAANLRAQILQWTGIPVSIGVAPTKTLAKAAAEYAKKAPQTGGVYSLVTDQKQVDTQRHRQLLQWLSVGDVWGIGWRTAPKLRQRGISSAEDLTRASDPWAQQHLSITGLKTVKELRGQACIGITQEAPQQSIMRTRLFGHTVRNYYELEGAIATFVAQAAAKLRQQGEAAGAVLTFLRTANRFTDNRGASSVIRLLQPSAETGALIKAALQGLQQVYDPDFSYKKGGIVLLNLTPKEALQLSFLQGPKGLDRQARLMQTVDALNTRFGTRLVRHASEHPEDASWRSKREHRSPSYTTSWQGLQTVKLTL